jgi:hypothetical protein
MNRTSSVIATRTLASLATVAATSLIAVAGPTDFTASGANPADITAVVDAFRVAISAGGGNNGVGGGPLLTGRREINWDAPALDAFASPNAMPDNFFNNNSRRGSLLTASGGGRLLVSQRTDGANARFGDINPEYRESFKTFSPLRLFAVEGGNTIDNTFFVPSNPGQAATINGFGAIFTDVDRTDSTAIEFFTELNGTNVMLRRLLVPASVNGGMSFAGTFFGDGERVSMVRIIAGNAGLGAGVLDSVSTDVVAMDDFFYSEPIAVPGPGALALLAVGGVFGARRRRA